MIELRDIHYARIGTRDLDTAEHFATQVMGLEKVERTADRLYLRSGGKTLTETWLYQYSPPPKGAPERTLY